MLPGAELPLPRALVDVVVGGVVVTGRVERLRPTGLVVELPGALPPGDGVELYWNGADGVRVVPARVVLCWTVRTGVRVQLVPSGPAEAGNRRDAVRADLRLRAQLTERESGAVFLGRTRDVSETGLRCLLAPGPLAVLARLAAAGGDVVPRARLLAALPSAAGDHAVDVAVARVRAVLPDGVVRTVVKRGYALERR